MSLSSSAAHFDYGDKKQITVISLGRTLLIVVCYGSLYGLTL